MRLEWLAAVDGDRPIVAESHERTQEHPGEARAVSAYDPQPTILTEGAVGVFLHVHL
jgi:hypothetical protein